MRSLGFTLLELLVVVFLLSAIALSGVAVVDEFDNQSRYDQTRSRLMQLRAGIVGADGSWTVRGFVADNGALPADIETLLRRPASLAAFGAARAPTFKANGAVGDITLNSLPLAKGWRGPYLVAGATRDPGSASFRDGWSNRNALDVDDALFHGWSAFTPSDEPLLLRSHGANGVPDSDPGSVADYDGDLIMPIVASDWSGSAAELVVTASNLTGQNQGMRAVLLVWIADDWIRINGDRVIAGADTTVTLPLPDATVPIGTHLVVLVDEANDIAGDGEAPYGHASGAPPIAARVTFAPRTPPKPVSWEVR